MEGEILGFNVIAWEGHILVIPRKRAWIFKEDLVVSSPIFMGWVMMKDEEVFDSMDEQAMNPLDILKQITYPN